MKKNVLVALFALIIFFAGLFLGHKNPGLKNPAAIDSLVSVCKNDYAFINPDIACDLAQENSLETVQALELNIREFIASSKKGNKAINISVFFRDLTSKKWVGVDQNENYAPASLMKLPLAVAYFKLAEAQPDIFSHKMTYQGAATLNEMQDIKPDEMLVLGKEYSVQELLDHMIIYSDNGPVDELNGFISQDFLNKVFSDLGVRIPSGVSDGSQIDFLSPRAYAEIFRALYNSSYLARPSSEKVLELLNQAKFKDGLVAGLPSGINVSHKFGERNIFDKSGALVADELHDCGIIYYPERPYILCVMTKGKNFDDLKNIIKEISRITYNEVSKK